MNSYRKKTDYFSKQAKKYAFRSRAYYKLQQIHKKHKLIFKSSKVLDLGAAPGGWSTFCVGITPNVLAVDILEIEPIEGVEFLQEDVFNLNLSERKFDVILSDMSPNLSGIREKDQLASLNLVKKVFEIAEKFGEKKYDLLFKVFQSPEAFQF